MFSSVSGMNSSDLLAERPRNGRTPLLLLVGDKAELALELGSTLSHFGYSLIFSRTIDDAIGVARAREPHLVICQTEMHGRPVGVQLTHGIREHLPRMPVILLSDHPAPTRKALAGVGEVEVVDPNTPTALLLAIGRLLQLQPHG